LGSTTVTWTVTDVNGNTATAEQIVTVSDTEAPTITAPAAVSTTADAGACEATGVDLGSPTTADNCGVASVSNDAPASFPLGSTTVTWTVTDVNGNTATAEQIVTVSDTEAPTFTCPADVSASNDPSECGAFVSFDLPEAVDNCGMVTLIQSEGDPSGSFFAVGSSTITYIATDEAGNMATCSFAVQVVDAESPMIACNQLIIQLGIQGSATLSPEELVSSAVDNCGVASFVALLTTFDNNSLGLNFVPVTATDVHGNTSTCFAEVTVLPFEGCNSIGGTISTGSNTNVCIGQGTGVLDVSLTGAQGDNSLWAVTPGNSFNVIAVRFNNPNFNFANFSPGNYRLWHLSYADDVSLAGITNGLQLEGCFDASNPIAVTVSIAIGGTITTASNTTICVGDGNPDVINAQVFGAAGDNQRWVLTDNALNVLAVRANNSNFPLDALAPGTYRIYHVAYANGVNVNGITNGNGLQGCIDVSNAITITAQNCGPLSAVLSSQPNPTAGPSVVQFSLPANERVTLEVYDLNGRLIEAIYSGEAQTNVEYRFDFDSSLLPNGIYLYRLTTASEIVVDKFMVAR
jgi:hypothetical protein